MDELLREVVNWVQTLSPILIYLVLLVIAFAENVLPPVPGDLVIVFAGYLVGLDRLAFVPAIIVASIGGTVGFLAMFGIGSRLGAAVLAPDKFRWVPKKKLELALDRVVTYGYVVVVVNRFLPGLRSVISLASGMSPMRLWYTGLAASVSAIVWSWLMVLLGKQLGENWEYVNVILRKYSQYFLSIVGVIVIIRLALYVRDRRSDPPSEDAGFTDH